MIIDLLDNLEWYRSLHPMLEPLISFLDQGVVYEQAPGRYQEGGFSYEIQSYFSAEEPTALKSAALQLQILLEGSELYSIQREGETRLVTTVTEGLFLVLQPGTTYRTSAAESGSTAIKKVIFTLP